MRRKSFKKLVSVLAGAMFLTAIPFTNFNTTKAEASYRFCPTFGGCEILENGNFENGRADSWKLVVVDKASAVGQAQNGAYKVTINNPGYKDKAERWAVNLKQNHLTLVQGHIYSVSFTVKADHDCMIYPTIGDEGYPYNEYWNCEGNIHGYSTTWIPIELKAGETKTVHGNFKMDKTVDKCCIQFHMSGDCAPKDLKDGETYSYTFSNISVKG